MFRISVFISLLICFACTKPKEQLTMPEEQMIELLLDAHIIEATLSEVSKELKDSMNKVYYTQFYLIHKVSPHEFEKNKEIIQRDPDLTNRIYQRLNDTLEVRVKSVEEAKQNELKQKRAGKDEEGQKK